MIDVLLPYFGDPQHLREAVRSVQEQTSPDWRLIIVNDDYPDSAIHDWLTQLSRQEVRVVYERNEKNLGANRNYTKVLGLAKADLVVIMGADDMMLPNYLAVMEDSCHAFPNAAAYSCGVDVIDDSGQIYRPIADRVKRSLMPRVRTTQECSGDRVIASLLLGNWAYFPSICWRRETIVDIGFRTGFHIVQDLALLVDVLRRGESLAISPEIAFEYRRHRGSDSAKKTLTGERFREEQQYFRVAAQELGAVGYSRASRAARLHLTSRLHAISLIPSTIIRADVRSTLMALSHAISH